MPVALVALAATSLSHHVHNAEFLDAYPNMPAWLSPMRVYAAWILTSVLGLVGYLLLKRGHRPAGLVLLVGYACYGLDSLVHYALAPVWSHSMVMNLSIWLEAIAALALLAILVRHERLAIRPRS